MKIDVAVGPNGRACVVNGPHKGHKADINTLWDNIREVRHLLKKKGADIHMTDHGESHEEHPSHWAALLDKACISLERDIHAVAPKKKPKGGVLVSGDVKHNKKIASDWVLPENYFGRLCELFGMLFKQWQWDSRFHRIMQKCM